MSASDDLRYQAKLEARRNGTTKVTVHEPAPPAPEAADPSSVDARYRAKLAARLRPAAPVTVPESNADAFDARAQRASENVEKALDDIDARHKPPEPTPANPRRR